MKLLTALALWACVNGVFASTPVRYRHPLELSAIIDCTADQLRTLLKGGADPNAVVSTSGHPDRMGMRPLHVAAGQGSTEKVAVLLAAGARVNATNIDGATPLYDACANGELRVAKLLVQHGANVNLATRLGATPLFVAEHGYPAALASAAKKREFEALWKYLRARHAKDTGPRGRPH